MAITILDRPVGPGLSSATPKPATIGTDGYGTAIMNPHTGIFAGDRVFIYNAPDSYLGFWYVSAYGPSALRLQRYLNGPYLEYTVGADVLVLVHNVQVKFSCVHLPIQYRLTNNKFPTNSFDTTRSIVGYANNNGFVRITLSGSIDADELDWLTIAATSEDELDGAFQITAKHSPTQFTVNAPYSVASASPYIYSTATATRYYRNYNMRIRVYGGLAPTHQWASLKPYELIAEYEMTPDDDNEVLMNVADILKKKIEISRNRPNYDSMPYDLDRFAQFYIEYAEAFDESDGNTIENFVGAYQSDYDFFQGVAVDAKLEFKNRYSGYLTDYYGDGAFTLAQFLTPTLGVTLWQGHYFDLSFINDFGQDDLILSQDVYDGANNLIGTTESTLTGYDDTGILRIPILAGSSDAKQIISLEMVTSQPITINAIDWANYDVGNNWTIGATLSFNSPSISKRALTLFNFVEASESFSIDYSFTRIGGSGRLLAIFTDGTTNPIIQQVVIASSSNSGTATATFVVTTPGPYYIGFYVEELTAVVSMTADITAVSWTTKRTAICDELTIDVDQNCYSESIYLTWKNNTGGFGYFLFTANKDNNVNILETQEKSRNIFTNWTDSYNEFADTINYETSRRSRNELVVRAGNLTKDQVDYITGIRTSSLVQQLTSKYDRRTVKIDTNGFRKYTDGDQQYEVEFTIIYGDEIPSQSV